MERSRARVASHKEALAVSVRRARGARLGIVRGNGRRVPREQPAHDLEQVPTRLDEPVEVVHVLAQQQPPSHQPDPLGVAAVLPIRIIALATRGLSLSSAAARLAALVALASALLALASLLLALASPLLALASREDALRELRGVLPRRKAHHLVAHVAARADGARGRGRDAGRL